MKKLLSYLWPLTTKLDSDHNGVLELTWYNGKKLLDTKNANYSYGLLQKVLETGLKEIDLSKVNSVLLLGLGGGSVVKSLREKFNYTGSIHAIELDAKVIAIAESEFGISNSQNLSIEQGDALSFVKHCSSKYDLIIVDLFIDTLVPEQFLGYDFCNELTNISSYFILYNLGIELPKDDLAHEVSTFFKNSNDYKVNILKKVEQKNTLLLVEKNQSK